MNRLKSREEEVKNLLKSGDDSSVEEAESKQAELLKKREDIKQVYLGLKLFYLVVDPRVD